MDFYRLSKIYPSPFPGIVRALFSKYKKNPKPNKPTKQTNKKTKPQTNKKPPKITANQIEHTEFDNLYHTWIQLEIRPRWSIPYLL